ncbi:MAG: PKD domain-containing protein [Bacteroidales bacterium]|nr:PKD domain-containing protein [Bacteroidales bacterium]
MGKFYHNIIAFVLLICIAKASAGANPQILSVTPNNTSVPRYEKLELTVNLTATFNSPYDFDQVNLQCTFTSPTGKVFVVDGFYYQDFTMTQPNVLVPNGQPDWRIRFAPNETGTWSYLVKLTDTQGSTTHISQQFSCTNSSHKGFVKRDGDHLLYDNGNRFLALGTNLAWTEWASGFTIYNDWLNSLKNNGGNYVKITMAPWIFGLEWGAGSLGNYTGRQNRAWGLDWVFEKLQQQNIYCQFHFLVHDELRTDYTTGWNENPYKSSNGGPCNNPQDFFTNATAKKNYKQKMRYSNARWGYSSYLHSWEVMSETDNTGFYSSNYTQTYNWVNEMSDYIRNIDNYDRPVSSGFAWPQNDPNYWNSSQADYTQSHIYANIPDLEMKVYNYSKYYLDRYQKPHIVGEFALGHDPSVIYQSDPNGVAFHNVLWSSVFSGSMGSAMSWWWDNYLYPNGFFSYFQPISSLINQANINDISWYHDLPLTSSNVHETLEVFPDFSSTSQKAPSNDFTIGPSGSISPTEMDLGQHLYGSLYNSLRNPPKFHVHYIKPGKFKVRTGNTVVLSKIRIRLNGVSIINTNASANTTYSIDVPEGFHFIDVENSGTGIMRIEKYQLENYKPQIRAFTLRKNNQVLGWFQNINYNWKRLLESGPPPPYSGGKINMQNLSPGLYKINWYNGNATIDSAQYKFTADGNLQLDVPPVVWDGAFDAKFFVPFHIDFAATPRTGFSPLTVQFTDQTIYTTGGTFNWMWTFGDGTFSFQQNPQKIYTNPGIYTVTLQVSSGQYVHSVTRQNFIVVDQPVVADFVGAPTIVLPGSPVQFADLSVGNPTSWMWTFGDGTLSFQQNPSKTYTQPGIYTVSLMVQKGSQSNTKTRTNYIQVLTPLIANFFSSATTSLPGQVINFTDQSIGIPTTWYWDFGNGTTSTVKNPMVTYSTPGLYSVSLTVTNAYQQNTITKTNYIHILSPLIANFEGSPVNLLTGQQVSFNDLSLGNPTGWIWDFGDGMTSTLPNPVHSFSQEGYFTISLTVNDPLQTSTETKPNYIYVEDTIFADFTTNQTTSLPGQTIPFYDNSQGDPTSWFWDFGNGLTSTLQNPEMVFNDPGAYSISLTIATGLQQNTITKSNYITILVPLIADFKVDTTFAWTGQTISFTDLTTGSPEEWLWDFGDGQTSMLQHPVHVYSDEAYYTVTLIVNNLMQSSTETKTDYIYIREPLSADFTSDTTIVIPGQPIQFTDLSSGFPETWFWTFGDGFSSYAQYPMHQYSNSGEYNVSLRVKRDNYTSNTVKTKYIKVLPPLVADFTTDKQVAFVDETIQFTDLSIGEPYSWFWDFGNFSNAVIQHPETSYSEPGVYTIELAVSNEYQQDVRIKENFITIIEPLVASFTSNFQEVKIGEKVQFFDLTTGSPDYWKWIFSSGDSSFVQNPFITFWEPGYVDVTLIAANQYLTDTLILSGYINVLPPTYTQVISIEPGWSGISTYIQPVFPSIEAIFAPVADQLIFAVNEQGMYWPALNINTIGFWDTSKGLIINMLSSDSLTMEGYQLVEGQLPLFSGWNLFPIVSSCDQPVELLQDIMGLNFEVIKTADGVNVYWPEIGVNTLGTLKPGKSYMMLISQDTLFTFPSCSGQ